MRLNCRAVHQRPHSLLQGSLKRLPLLIVCRFDEVFCDDKVVPLGESATDGCQYAAIAKHACRYDVPDLHLFQRIDEIPIREHVIAVLGKDHPYIGRYPVELLCMPIGFSGPVSRLLIVPVQLVDVVGQIRFLPGHSGYQDDPPSKLLEGCYEGREGWNHLPYLAISDAALRVLVLLVCTRVDGINYQEHAVV
jgi:hypothetical protein